MKIIVNRFFVLFCCFKSLKMRVGTLVDEVTQQISGIRRTEGAVTLSIAEQKSACWSAGDPQSSGAEDSCEGLRAEQTSGTQECFPEK